MRGFILSFFSGCGVAGAEAQATGCLALQGKQ